MIDSRLDTISACDRRTETTRWQIPRYAEQERRSGNNVMVKSAPELSQPLFQFINAVGVCIVLNLLRSKCLRMILFGVECCPLLARD